MTIRVCLRPAAGEVQKLMSKTEGFVNVDPATIWYTHARIRPYFSGCGTKIEDTIKQIEDGILPVQDLPFITVINNGGNLFSLNNRRLFVLKTLRERGFLRDNQIRVRLKSPLEREKEKYLTSKCSLNASIMMEYGEEKSCDEPEAEAVASAAVPTQLATVKSLPKLILREIPGLTKLFEDGKAKKAKEKIEGWVQSGVITPEQREIIMKEIVL